MAKKPIKYPYNGEEVRRCKFCPADIYWVKTEKGRHMPVNRSTQEPHWATCPGANKARKPKGGNN